jgi:ATP adenylyltransferase
MALDHLWAGWRGEYLASAGDTSIACVFCRILASGEDDEHTFIVWRGVTAFAILNAYPYTSGHLLVMPLRHVGTLEELEPAESAELWAAMAHASAAVTRAYDPEGMNIGLNLGRAAGAGVPGHLHVHVVPRWFGDSNFMTAVAEARVLPEALVDTAARIRKAWEA